MIKRDELLVYFNYRSDTLKYLQGLNVTIQYLSKKAGYAVLYVDDSRLGKIIYQLKQMKGFKGYEVSPTDLEELNIDLGNNKNNKEEDKTNGEAN